MARFAPGFALGQLQRADPTLTACQPVGVIVQHLLDRSSQRCNGGARARPFRGKQDQTRMRSSLREPFGGKRPEVLDVVGDHSTFLSCRDLEDDSVNTSDKVVALGDSDNVVSSLAQQLSDPWRELFVD